jgi:hypothetical protein
MTRRQTVVRHRQKLHQTAQVVLMRHQRPVSRRIV